ncbi:uncharacterized protein LOC131841589 [Achroia grisella]|uniref:uncharacterized protein LOC131841589 n=1 Tax=Achroia grisella TaxID=688607 RepID=UPI0027D1F2EE|nr:uncharacterized protein LOC131841589 [Achroia grisella]
MGSNTSKPSNDTSICSKKNDDFSDNSADPRSPTPEIIRTPLQGKPNGKHNITKNVDLRKTFENAKTEEKLIHNNPILSAVIKNHLQSYDPRSPTQDFERTPIIITSKIDKLQSNIQEETGNNCGSPCLRTDYEEINESLEEAAIIVPDTLIPKNLCDGFYDITLNDTLKEPDEPLGSSTASNEAIEANISDTEPTKLLETNFEYVEGENNKTDENVFSGDDIDFFKFDIKQIPVFKILDEDPRSPSVGIERTPIVVAKKTENISNENVEHMSDDSLIKVLQNTNAELRQNVVKPQEKNSDGLLIYEDESDNINDTPKKSKSASNSGSRTPLSCMKNKSDTGHSRSKSANTLYDPKNPAIGLSKVSRKASHIPRLKSLSKQVKTISTGSTISLKTIGKTATLGGDCENTPPHSHRDKWDKNSSIVL